MPNVHFLLEYLLWKHGQFADAAVQFQKELTLNRQSGAAATYLGDIEVKNNQDEDSRALLEFAKLQPDADKLAFLHLGILDARAGKTHEAETEFERVIAMAPKDPDAHWRMVRLLKSMGRQEEAVKELETVRQLHADKDSQPLQR